MKVSPLPEDADALIAFAESIATVLSEKKEELGVSTELEALLRSSIESATFGDSPGLLSQRHRVFYDKPPS